MPRGRRPANTQHEDLPAHPRRRATTPEQREQQLIALSYDLAEKRIREGTASAQENTFFLKMGSSRERLEQQRIAHENELLVVKREAIAQQARTEELFADAIRAMRSYQGDPSAAMESLGGEVDVYDD